MDALDGSLFISVDSLWDCALISSVEARGTLSEVSYPQQHNCFVFVDISEEEFYYNRWLNAQ